MKRLTTAFMAAVIALGLAMATHTVCEASPSPATLSDQIPHVLFSQLGAAPVASPTAPAKSEPSKPASKPETPKVDKPASTPSDSGGSPLMKWLALLGAIVFLVETALANWYRNDKINSILQVIEAALKALGGKG